MSLGEQQDQAKIGLRSRPGVRKLARRRKHKVERRAARIDPEHPAAYKKFKGYET